MTKISDRDSPCQSTVNSHYNGHHRHQDLVSVMAGVVFSNSYSLGLQKAGISSVSPSSERIKELWVMLEIYGSKLPRPLLNDGARGVVG